MINTISRSHSQVLITGLLYAGAAMLMLPLSIAEAQGSPHVSILRADLPIIALITLLGGGTASQH